MALLAQDLPIRHIPKENLIALVRNDVIDNCCGSDYTHSLAFHAKGMS